MAELLVDLGAIRGNTAAVATMLAGQGISLVAVTKGCLAEPAVAAEMLAGGAVALADTRDAGLRRLRAAFPDAELHRIHLPPPSGPFEPGDVTYVSGAEAVTAVARLQSGRSQPPAVRDRWADRRDVQRVMVLLETGDGREGVPGEFLPGFVDAIRLEPGLEFAGLATNYACFEGRPEGIRGSVAALADAVRLLREAGVDVPRVSGGNSSLLALLLGGEVVPEEVTEVRCGEALLLGQDALFYEPLPGCRQDACRLRATVLERYTKPASGWVGPRLVVGLGHQDLAGAPVRFLSQGLRDLGRSSDYLVLGVEDDGPELVPGDAVEMVPSYRALVAAWTSPFVEVRFE